MEARLLAAHALGTTQAGLLRNRAAPVDPAPLEPLLRRRIAHEPLALIVGHREFWSLDFAVSPATLIPRPSPRHWSRPHWQYSATADRHG